jgi:hypothetical protein
MDTTEDNVKSQEGGVEWEARQALAHAESALIAAGIDPEAYMTAARRHTEAVRNMMLVELVPSFEKALQSIIDKSGAAALAEGVAEVKALLKTQTQNQRAIEADVQSRATYFYKHFDAFLKDADARFTSYDQSIATVEEVARGLGKFSVDIEELKAGQAAYNERLDQVINRLNNDEERFDERLDSKRARLDEHDERLAVLERVIKDRPSQREAEWAERQEALVVAIVERLKQDRGDG